jgi:hypothetical protein
MWLPESAEELERLAREDVLEETAAMDYKKELGKNKEIAKDVAAMANDGGVICYGIGEDERGRPCCPEPIRVEGQPERIMNVVRTSISEPPSIDIRTIISGSNHDQGYIFVLVPQSPLAPHMVVVDKDFRFYGRGALGNVPLTQGEVERLYERRRVWGRDVESSLDRVELDSQLPAKQGFGYLRLAASPVGSDGKIFERSRKQVEEVAFLSSLIEKSQSQQVFKTKYFGGFSDGGWRRTSFG